MKRRCSRQAGMVLLISLVFLLLLSLVGVASMQAATSQAKITGSQQQRNQVFQHAESGLRLGESAVQAAGFALGPCRSIATCMPPGEAVSVTGPGTHPVSAVTWVGMKEGVYGVQNLGPGTGVAHLPAHLQATLYRVTSVGLYGQSRAVLESVYAKVTDAGGVRFRRVMWRQLQ